MISVMLFKFLRGPKSLTSKGSSSTYEAETTELTVSEYFIAQYSFDTYKNNINFDILKKESIAAFEEDIEKIKRILGIDEITTIDGEDLYSWFRNEDFDGVALVPPDKADFRLKTLDVNEINFWDTERLSDYTLVWQDVVSIEKEKIDELKESNFDQSQVVSYIAGGEVIPARAVARKFRRTSDYTFPFHDVRDLFNEADISSITLENAISQSPDPCYGCVWFVGDEAFIQGLEYLGVDVVSLAGNHMGDGGEEAVSRTIEVLNEGGIDSLGASTKGQDDASNPAVVEIGDFTIAFLGYDDVAYYHWAGDSVWGTAKISQRNSNGTKDLLVDKIESDIKRAREKAEFVVVIMSWGDREYINWALDYQREMGHTLVDKGADLVIGSHQHWVNEIEFYENKAIFYGVGNFVFDQTHSDPTRQGVLLKFYFYQKKLVSVRIIPHETCGPQQSVVDDENCNHFQPRILDEEDPVYKEILDRMFEHSNI